MVMMDSESSSISFSQSLMASSMAVLNALGQVQFGNCAFSSRSNSLIAYQRARWGSTMEPSWAATVRVMVMHGFLPVVVGDQVFDVRKRVFHAARRTRAAASRVAALLGQLRRPVSPLPD